MRSRPTAIVGVLLALALLLQACGGGGGGGSATAAQPQRRGSTVPRQAAQRQGDRCRRQLHGLVSSLDRLRDRLAIGLSYGDYLAEVREVKAAHGEIDARRLGLGCLSLAGAPAERALNEYIEAVNAWGDCLAVASCDAESVEPKLQRSWRRASVLVASAQRGIRRASSG